MQIEIKEALKAIKEERYATAEVLLEQLVHRKTTLRMEDIAAIAEQYGEWDDFGRWTFRTDDRLLAFVDAVNMSQECVDETAKGKHDLWIAAACLKSTVESAIKAGDWKVDGACDPTRDLAYLADCLANPKHEWAEQPDLARVGEVGVWGDKREWVGLEEEEILKCFDSVALGQVEGDCVIDKHVNIFNAIRAIEAKLKEKNA